MDVRARDVCAPARCMLKLLYVPVKHSCHNVLPPTPPPTTTTTPIPAPQGGRAPTAASVRQPLSGLQRQLQRHLAGHQQDAAQPRRCANRAAEAGPAGRPAASGPPGLQRHH